MEKYNIEFLPVAYTDLDNIFDYIILDSIKEADLMLERIIKSLDRLKEFPLSGKRLIHKSLNYYNFRIIIVNPYIVFYRFIDNTVYIYRVLHGASDYVKILESGNI